MKQFNPPTARQMRSSASRTLLVLGLILGSFIAKAQTVSTYSFAQSVGTYSNLTGGTQLFDEGDNVQDETPVAVTIPAFWYAGAYYTTMYVTSNGFITFGAAPSSTEYDPISSTDTYAGAISAFGADIEDGSTGGSGGNTEIRWSNTGGEVVVQWRDMERNVNSNDELFSCQIRMNLSTGVIRLMYSAVTGVDGSTSEQPQVGLRGPNNTLATNVRNRLVNTSGGSNTWNTSINGTANTSTCRFTTGAGFTPASGQTYTFTPPCTPPTQSAAGPDQTICQTPGSATMAANTAVVGTGTWTQVGGTAATITTPGSPTTTITGMTTAGARTFRWTIANSTCTNFDDVVITVNAPAATANAGPDQNMCITGTTPLAANSASPGTGAWTILGTSPSTSTSQISNLSSPTATFNPNGAAGVYTLRWTTTNSPCASTQDDVDITVIDAPTTSNAGPDQNLCTTTSFATLAANTGVGTGAWTVVSVPGGASSALSQFSNTAAFNSTFTPSPLVAGTYTLRWTISSGPCTPSGNNVDLIWAAPPATANAGPDQTMCITGTIPLAANSASPGTGAWTILPGSPSTANSQLSSLTSPTATFNPSGTAGVYTLRWTTSNGVCASTQDDVAITVDAAPTTANAGADQTICPSSGAATMTGNTIVVGTGVWSQVSGPLTATITTTAMPNAVMSGMTTAGTYVFQWTATNGLCSANDQMSVIVSPPPTMSVSGLPGTICANGSTTLSAIVTAPISSSATASSGAITAAIPNLDVNGVTRTLTLAGVPGNIGTDNTVTVTISATHPNNADLDFYLIGPANCGAMELSTDNGGNGDNYAGTLLRSVSAFTNISTLNGVNTTNISGNWSPEKSFSTAPDVNNFTGFNVAYGIPTNALTGCPVNGTWTLFVADDGLGSSGGVLTNWSLTIDKTVTGNYVHAFSGAGTISGVTNSGVNNSTGTVTVSNPPAGLQTYTIQTTSPVTGCTTTNTVDIDVIAAPNPGTSGFLTLICSNAPAVSLDAILGGTQDPGAWTGPSAVIGGMYDPASMTPGLYTYTVTGTAPCANGVATVTVTEDPASTWYLDVDGDGSGVPGTDSLACAQPTGYAANDNDLCPFDPNKIAPGACGCGVADVATTYYADTDGDGFGDPGAPLSGFTCITPAGYVSDNTDNCPNLSGLQGDLCDDFNPFTLGDVITGACVCAGTPVPCTEDVMLEFRTDDNGGQTSWEIKDDTSPFVVCSGSTGSYGNNTPYSTTCCLVPGCYILSFFDSFGDGMCCSTPVGEAGYRLYDENGKRIIDSWRNGTFASTSSIGQPFCVPMGSDKMTLASCDREDLLPTSVVVASANAAVTAEFGVTNTTSGYGFWIYDPHGSYSRKIFLSHANPGHSIAPGPTEAAHLRLSQIISNPVPQNILLNIRVRGRVAGNYLEFGPACRLKIDAGAAYNPSTQLDNDPLHIGTTYSCGVSGKVVGASGNSGKIWANPAVRNPGAIPANKYEFVFEVASEGYSRTIRVNSYVLVLGPWGTNPLLCGTVGYDVKVRASFDAGATWGPFGAICSVGITNNPPNPCTTAFNGGGHQNSIVEDATVLAMWPNPNRGDQLYLQLNDVEEGVTEVSVDLYDLFGKQVMHRVIPVEGAFNTVLQLNSELAAGLYTVSLTAGTQTYNERLTIE